VRLLFITVHGVDFAAARFSTPKRENSRKRFFFQGVVPLDDVHAVFRMASSAQKRGHGR
jgi:hypothetical protein